jgi:hypothetical protein
MEKEYLGDCLWVKFNDKYLWIELKEYENEIILDSLQMEKLIAYYEKAKSYKKEKGE